MSSHLTWIEVDLSAIQNNVRRMKALTGTRVMAVVKANAYGHGVEAVARAATLAGVDWLGVARVSEGLALRESGIGIPILALGFTPRAQAAEAIGGGLSLTVFDYETVQAYATLAQAVGSRARVHIKVETGMGRLGLLPEEVVAFARAVKQLAAIEMEGIFTHFACADEPDLTSARRQRMKFETVLAALAAEGLCPPLVHAANSAAALGMPEARYDLVRTGIALYGLPPSAAVPCPPEFVPALTWKASVTQVKTLPAGHGVSYGSVYTTTRPEKIAVLPVGYADGFRREPNNEVLLHGQRAPVRGRVCMDQVIIGIDHLPEVRVGDEVVLIGSQAAERLSAEELGRRWNTINYEVICGISARVARLYK